VQKNVRGLIYVSCVVQTNEVVEGLIASRFPLVFLDRIAEDKDTNVVFSDNLEGAYQAAKYLLRLGHHRIAYVAGVKTTSTERDRFKGFCRALEEEGIALDPQLVVNGEYDLEKAYEGTKALISSNVEFSAVFSSNDLMAFGVKQALEEGNLKVPDDVSIVGYDDIYLAHTISLTVIAQPIVEMGRSAMTLLLDLIDNRLVAPQSIVHRPSLIIRNSCNRL
jgi:LacI family transcriptional regulator